MKTKHRPSPCIVQSVTYTPERRVMTFTSTVRSPIAAQPAVKRRKAPFRLKILTAPEAKFSFEPAIQVRSQANP